MDFAPGFKSPFGIWLSVKTGCIQFDFKQVSIQKGELGMAAGG